MLESKTKRILIVDNDISSAGEIKKTMEEQGYFAYISDKGTKAIDSIYNEPPDLIILELVMPDMGGDKVCKELKNDNFYGHLPIIMLIPKEKLNNKIKLEELMIDDYIVKPFTPQELILRTSLSFGRANRELDANPLTRLPGNHSILKEIQKRIDCDTKFSLAILDIDNFKSFNDKCGFSRGDEVLRMTARLLTNIIRGFNSSECYVGHVGGDDFVFIVPPSLADETCKQIIKNFDLIIPTFYDEEDRIRGYIDSVDRTGEKNKFPIMTISIAVASNDKKKIRHCGEASEITSRLKKLAKSIEGSNYVKDRRR